MFTVIWRAEGALRGGGAGAGGPSGAEQHRRSRSGPRLEVRGVRSGQPPAQLGSEPSTGHSESWGGGGVAVVRRSLTHHITKGDQGGLGLTWAMQRAKEEPLLSLRSYLFSFQKIMPTTLQPESSLRLPNAHKNTIAKLGVCRYGGGANGRMAKPYII